MRVLLLFPPLLAALLLAAGCGKDATGPEQRDEIALSGFLYVGETVNNGNAILICRTMPVDQYYQFENAVIENALVTLKKRGDAKVDTLTRVRPGYYSNPAVLIDSLTTYDLLVVIPGRPPLTASTTTPRPIRVLSGPREMPATMRYSVMPDSFPLLLQVDDPEQILLMDVYCQEDYSNARYINPFGNQDYPRNYQEYGGDGPPRHISAYFRAKNLDRLGDTYRLSWYADMLVFYGRYEVGLYAIDDNYYNYLYRDHPELQGGVTGGIGVFGSACRKEYHILVAE